MNRIFSRSNLKEIISRPAVFLGLMAVANALAFAVWQGLLNNFTITQANFTGKEIGILHSLREIPGLLAFTAVYFLLFFKEQYFALFALLLLGLGTALTGFFPSIMGLYLTTLLMSFGFHYYETMNQSLALQWLPKEQAPRVLGRIIAVGSIATICAYGFIYVAWNLLGASFNQMYVISGGVTIGIVIMLYLFFPHHKEKVQQTKGLVLRKRYWLYYVLNLSSGARRQIFVVFAGFMMVEKFGFDVADIALVFLFNAAFNIIIAPKIGDLIAQFGERNMLLLEYAGLMLVFISYAFVEIAWIAVILYFIDHAFFGMRIALKTYFQKIGAPEDMAATAGVAFSINHVAAVVIPVVFGFIWINSHETVFLIGAAIAGLSFLLALLIPRDPQQGNEVEFPFVSKILVAKKAIGGEK